MCKHRIFLKQKTFLKNSNDKRGRLYECQMSREELKKKDIGRRRGWAKLVTFFKKICVSIENPHLRANKDLLVCFKRL